MEHKSVDEMLYVMVIDDQQAMRSILRQLLHQEHIDHIVEAANGKEAIAILEDPQQPKPDVIICDLVMDQMDGLQFINYLRRHKDHTPIIAITGVPDPLLHEVATQAGALKVLKKPISAPELASEIHKAVGAQ